MIDVKIRYEDKKDIEAIYRINISAFDGITEAEIINKLRISGNHVISLVAEINKKIVGHIFFSQVKLNNKDKPFIAGLAPMCVHPGLQKKGIGKKLVTEGLKECIKKNYEAVAVLGHPDYYPKFGFMPSAKFNIISEFDVPENIFMIKELNENALRNFKGVIYYHHVFKEFS